MQNVDFGLTIEWRIVYFSFFANNNRVRTCTGAIILIIGDTVLRLASRLIIAVLIYYR